MSNQEKLENIRQRIKDNSLTADQVAHSVSGYSPSYILKVLRFGIKDPSPRVLSVIEKGLDSLIASNNDHTSIAESNQNMPVVSREVVVSILRYQDSEEWIEDVTKWENNGISHFEARLLAILMHINKSIM